MRTAIYPGSFDPVTLGHLDLIRRASKMFDTLIVAVMSNTEKSPVFSVDERVSMLRRAASEIENVTVSHFDGLLVDFAREMNASAIVKGLRNVSDFDNEFTMALVNGKLNPKLETVFLMTSAELIYVSSRVARAVGIYGGDLSGLVPGEVLREVSEKLKSGRK